MPATRIIKLDGNQEYTTGIQDALAILRAGGLVAFPTETVYGLGANALNASAVQKVFKAKGRPADNPLIVHVASLEDAMIFTPEMPKKGLQLAKRFWPGPLTLVTKRKSNVPDIVTAGLETVALRVPNHPVTLELLRRFRSGIVGPSANISGRPSPTSAEHVYFDLNEMIDLIIDAGPTIIGVESTVLDITVDPPVILRLGGLSAEEIEEEIGEIESTKDKDLLKRSPGTRYRHYAPNAEVILFAQDDMNALNILISKNKNKNIGIISHSKSMEGIAEIPHHIRLESTIESYARNLFKTLRAIDQQDVDIILVESVEEKGLGTAVMDRLRKSALHSV